MKLDVFNRCLLYSYLAGNQVIEVLISHNIIKLIQTYNKKIVGCEIFSVDINTLLFTLLYKKDIAIRYL